MRTLVIQLDNIDETLRWTAATVGDRRTLQRQAAHEAHALGAEGVRVLSHDGQHVLYAHVFVGAPVEDDKHLEGTLIPFDSPNADRPAELYAEFQRVIARLPPAEKLAALTQFAERLSDAFDDEDG